MKLAVPFFENPDKTHCHQASLRMVMKYFWPGKEFTWEEMDQITQKVEGKATWEYAGNIWLTQHGMQVKVIQLFDDTRFIAEGVAYLKEFVGDEAAEWQAGHSDIPQAQHLAVESLKSVLIDMRAPTLHDIRTALDAGYLVTCLVNGKALDGKDGYDGHSIVVIGYTDEGVYVHDPGLPPAADRLVSNNVFENAWANPNENAKLAILYKPVA